MARSMDHDRTDTTLTRESVVRRHSSVIPRWDPVKDCVLAPVEGQIVGYGRVDWYQELADKRLCSIVGFMKPE